ncbi:hypothetical protein EC973_000360 [Apophysomyces ossiformis]|uniref:Uncharacterized protein n=1 Tax=Apophysomyces ossiformis TaxID=679940 RepID=A0A8H7BRG4_9FUNG|nr:hypothetical protein EC973_000360 [Apophysomyces ossiformis]
MSGTYEHRSELQFYYHVSHFLRQRLHDIKELEATDEDNMKQVNDLMRQITAHIQFVEDESSMSKEDKDAVSLDFLKLKLALSECQSAYNLRTANLSLQMVNSKLEDMTQKYDAKSQECKELELKLKSVESKITQSQPEMEKVDLQGPLAIVAKLNGSVQETRCFVFDKYTAYNELCKKIQEAFSLKSYTVQAKHDRDKNGFKTISTANDYKDIIQNLGKEEKSNGHAHLVEIYVEDKAEKENVQAGKALCSEI